MATREKRFMRACHNGENRWKNISIKLFRENGGRSSSKTAVFNIAATLEDKTEKLFSAVYEEWFDSVLYRIKGSTAANYTLIADKHILPAF